MKIPASVKTTPEAARAATILQGLDKDPPGAEVFEAFEALDDLPADVVRDVLASVTGPAPDAATLDPSLRRATGLPGLPRALRCARALHVKKSSDLTPVEQAQLRQTGMAWDGADLPADARLGASGDEASFAGSLVVKTFSDALGNPVYDVFLHGEGSGAIFEAGKNHVVGAVAYGVVELKDKLSREGLQAVLASDPDPKEEARLRAATVAARVAAQEQAAAAALAAERAAAAAEVDAEAETRRVGWSAAEATDEDEDEAAPSSGAVPTKKRASAPKKKTATAKKTTAKKTAKAPAKKAVVKKTAAKKAPAKKAVVKKAAAKKAPAKKAVVKKAAAKKTAAKKAPAKKTVAKVVKKAAAKKTAAPAKKTAAKKAPAKKTAPVKKKTAAKKKTGR